MHPTKLPWNQFHEKFCENDFTEKIQIFISFTYLSLFREVNHHRKKLTGRKLDFDCKKRQGANDEDVRKAEEKFAESLHLAQLGNLIPRRKKKEFNL